MTDPDRLMNELPGDIGRTLIEAGVDEQPSEAARRRALVALGIGVPVFGVASVALGASAAKGAAAGTSALASGSMVSGIVIAKWLGAGVAAGVLATATAQLVQRPSVTAPSARVAPAVVAAPKSEPLAPVVPRPVVGAPNVEEPEPARVTAPPAAPVVEAAPALPLAREVAFVDRARALLEGGNASGAAEALRNYEREFEQPKLLPEVWVLRMRAAERAGDMAGARILATRLVEVFPKSPHTARARQMLEKVTKENSVP